MKKQFLVCRVDDKGTASSLILYGENVEEVKEKAADLWKYLPPLPMQTVELNWDDEERIYP